MQNYIVKMTSKAQCVDLIPYYYYVVFGVCLVLFYHWRDNRSIHQNIIPASTGACKALGKIIPQVKDKLTGLAFRVPIVNVSVLDLTIRLNTFTSVQDIVKCVEKASKSKLHNIIKISNENAVSSDFIGDNHSCVLDVDSTLQLKPDFFKLICWYENEYSYACRVIDSIFFSEHQLIQSMVHVSKMTYVRPKVVKKQDEVQQTDQNIKEKAVACNYGDALPKITPSIIDNSFKQKTPLKKCRQLVVRKPLSMALSEPATMANSYDNKKRNDGFKIWAGDMNASKNSMRQNKDSLFNSCIAFSNLNCNSIKNLNAKERLDNVKKEFSKMLDITESLLKKSYSSKIKNNSTETFNETIAVADAELKGSLPDTTDINANDDKQENNMNIKQECGDFENKDENNNNNEGNQTKYCFYVEAGLKIVNNKTEVVKQEPEKGHSSTEISSNENSSSVNKHLQLTQQLEKVLITAIEKSLTNCSPKFEETSSNQSVEHTLADFNYSNNLNNTNTSEDTYKIDEIEVNDITDIDPYISQFVDKPTSIKNDQMINYSSAHFANYLRNNMERNIHIVDEELKKRNIILVTLDSNLNVNSVDTEPIIIGTGNSDETFLPCLKSFETKTDESMLPEKVSICSVSNTGSKIHKLDLYDKLDSASATDSDSSFQIHERKSQVIHITDLTSSIEDLSRLDKICKIIEISDELSDQLFSKLNNSKNPIDNSIKWSFNDLCDRIQLDEFCTKVFRKTGA